MAPFVESPVQAGTSILSKLTIANIGYFVIFLVVIIGFSFAASEKGSPPRLSPRPNLSQSTPGSCKHTYHLPSVRRGLALPTASIPKCLACQNRHSAAAKASPVSQEPIRPLQAPSPYHTRRSAPTGVLPAQSRSGRPAFAGFPPITPATTPLSPRLGYATRGPTATLHPAVW